MQYILFLFSFLLLSGCAPLGLATGAGATVGLSAAQEGGINRAVSDGKIQIAINDAWFQSSIEIFRKLDLTVNRGRVLVTGVVQDPQDRVEAIRLAWGVNGVKQVINEVQVAESSGIGGFVQDNWIAARIRTKMTFDKNIQSLNYNIDTVKGSVYLLGVAQDQVELNRVIETARSVSGVKQVVSYVKILGEDLDSDGFRAEEDNSVRESTSIPIRQNLDSPDIDESQRIDEQIWNDSAAKAANKASNAPEPLSGFEIQTLD